jgi:glycosyltransferase involved in cell wall biosynthesis
MRGVANRGTYDLVYVLLPGFARGGAEAVTRELLAEWGRRGRRVLLVTMGDASDDVEPAGVDIDRVALGVQAKAEKLAAARALIGQLPHAWRVMRRLRAAIRASGAPTVLSHLTSTNLVTILATRGLAVRLVVCEHNDTTRQRHHWPLRVGRRLLYRLADVVAAVVQISVDHMRYVPADRRRFVPNPIALPEEQARPDTSHAMLSVGRLVVEKDHVTAVEALARLGDRAAGWTLEILGDGPMEQVVRDRAGSFGLEDRVQIAGFVTDPTPHYLSAAIFLLPSRFEGMPMALLEAMAAGLPPVVSDALPGALAYVEHGVNGMVFRAGDAVDLADQIAILIEDPQLRARLGVQARQRMAELSVDRVVDRWDEILGFEPRPDRI